MNDADYKGQSETNAKNGDDSRSPKAAMSPDSAANFVFCNRCGHVIIVTGRHVMCPQCGLPCCPSCGE